MLRETGTEKKLIRFQTYSTTHLLLVKYLFIYLFVSKHSRSIEI